METLALKYLSSFVYMFFAEMLLTLYAIKAAEHKPHPAAFFAAMNTFVYCMNIENIIHNNWCILFSMFGAYAGTVASISISKRIG